ncbi:MAG: SMP-30/gluconolactonase/LRE family protein [Pseudomonadales bacterium]
MDVEVAAQCACRLGESPTWHAPTESLFWADIVGGALYRLPPHGPHEVVASGLLVSGISVQDDHSLLLLGRSGRVRTLRAGEIATLRRGSVRWVGYRFNDCIADPAGRVLAGVMNHPVDLSGWENLSRVRGKLRRLGVIRHPAGHRGLLSRLAGNGRPVPLIKGLWRPNGMAFSPRADVLYVTESGRRRILAFPYDVASGALGPARVLVDCSSESGVPDGLVTDSEGCLWSARNKAGLIVRYADDGRTLERISLPTTGVTSLTFGGRHLRDLYVTTARTASAAPADELAGAVFRLSTDVEGGTVYRSRLGLPGAVYD